MIKCPYCGMEYLPEEIFLPDDFSTDVRNITKDEKRVEYYLGSSLLNTKVNETYFCDHCEKEFGVSATLSFESIKLDESEDDFDYTIKLC